MEITIDSHALLWYFTQNKKLSVQAQNTLSSAQRIIIPAVVLLEILYILEKYKQAHKFVDLLVYLRNPRFFIHPVDIAVIIEMLSVSQTLEMHDRIIVATARIFNSFLMPKFPAALRALRPSGSSTFCVGFSA